ncbi:MAG: BrnT family toxin [Leptolyngbyaceae cyanobacterium CSU_1_4]|nr:BrnT family toxin [Leptolyngbyaceae cyanobacterium CSU_1_4]
MAYQWDREKAIANLNKHRIDFADAVLIFSDERFEEERFIKTSLA